MRTRWRQQAGMSLPEVMIAVLLMGVIVPILGSMMVSATRSGNEVRAASETVDELRLQLHAISRELRSAECINEPAVVPPAIDASGAALAFTTMSNGVLRELRYDVVDGELVRTVVNPDPDGDDEVLVVGGNLVGPAEPFRHLATPRRSVAVELHVRMKDDDPAQVVRTTIAGRNAWRVCT